MDQIVENKPLLTRWLERSPPWVFTLTAGAAAFATYFCMYAFRKPFAAAPFAGETAFFSTTVQFKTALVISQIIGYAISKFLGIKFCSEAIRSRRATMLVGLILAAEAALVLFGLAPGNWKILAIFFNGVPLGMVWGLVVWYLEGRRTTEILMAVLACSFIVASGVVKDVGLWLMRDLAVSESWMPALTGLLFLPLLLISVGVLSRLPQPTPGDVALRVRRTPMRAAERTAFLKQFLPGMVLLLAVYFFLTAFRDFRDNYGADVYRSLGYGDKLGLFSRTESFIGVAVLAAMALLYLVQDNRRCLLLGLMVMIGGAVLVGVGTLLFDGRMISGASWMMIAGLGAYLTYVPINALLFERLIASTRVAGTAVFAIMLADALGYTGSVLVQLSKDFAGAEMNRLDFLRYFSYFLAIFGTICLSLAMIYFARRLGAQPRRWTAIGPSATIPLATGGLPQPTLAPDITPLAARSKGIVP